MHPHPIAAYLKIGNEAEKHETRLLLIELLNEEIRGEQLRDAIIRRGGRV
jgi:hypothetical protein